MKIVELRIKGLGKIKDLMSIQLNKPLTGFFGDPTEGKSTILNAIKWVGAQRGYPAGLINNESDKAVIEIILDNGTIRKEFTEKGVKFEAIINNKKYSQKQVSMLFNPFQLNQNHFKEMNGINRNAFLLEIFEVDTSELDAKYIAVEKEAKQYRDEVKEFGKIDTTPVEKPKSGELKAAKKAEAERLTKLHEAAKQCNAELKNAWELKCTEIRHNWKIQNEKHLQDIQAFNRIQKDKEHVINGAISYCSIISQQLTSLENVCGYTGKNKILLELQEFTDSLPNPKEQKPIENLPDPKLPTEPEYEPETFDKTEYNRLTDLIADESRNELLYEQYLERLELAKKRDNTHALQLEKEAELREIKKQKAAKLSEYSGIIEGLIFDENGSAIFENTTMDMLSDSMIERLSSQLSGLYKNSIPVTLVDGAEKLGRFAVPYYIKYAKETGNDVLLTYVGERPAEIPNEATVYVVEGGKIN